MQFRDRVSRRLRTGFFSAAGVRSFPRTPAILGEREHCFIESFAEFTTGQSRINAAAAFGMNTLCMRARVCGLQQFSVWKLFGTAIRARLRAIRLRGNEFDRDRTFPYLSCNRFRGSATDRNRGSATAWAPDSGRANDTRPPGIAGRPHRVAIRGRRCR